MKKNIGIRDHGTSVIPVSKGNFDGLDRRIDEQLRVNKSLFDRILGLFKNNK